MSPESVENERAMPRGQSGPQEHLETDEIPSLASPRRPFYRPYRMPSAMTMFTIKDDFEPLPVSYDRPEVVPVFRLAPEHDDALVTEPSPIAITMLSAPSAGPALSITVKTRTGDVTLRRGESLTVITDGAGGLNQVPE